MTTGGDGSSGDGTSGDGTNTGGTNTGGTGGTDTTGAGGTSTGSGDGSGGSGDGTQSSATTPQQDALATLLGEMGLSQDQAISRIRNAPKWEKNARDNYRKAQESGTLAEQIKALQQRDLERSGRLAISQVHALLAEHDVKPGDVKGILARVNGTDLLKEGEPDDDAVRELADSLLKVAGRVQADPDQGKTGGNPPESMNDFIRRQAGRGSRTIR
jgi:hypothetical protein